MRDGRRRRAAVPGPTSRRRPSARPCSRRFPARSPPRRPENSPPTGGGLAQVGGSLSSIASQNQMPPSTSRSRKPVTSTGRFEATSSASAVRTPAPPITNSLSSSTLPSAPSWHGRVRRARSARGAGEWPACGSAVAEGAGVPHAASRSAIAVIAARRALERVPSIINRMLRGWPARGSGRCSMDYGPGHGGVHRSRGVVRPMSLALPRGS